MELKKAKQILCQHKNDLSLLGVKKLSLFGSIAKNKQTVRSDIDVLIEFDAKKGIFAFVDLKNYLESLLKCEVDLVTKEALHPALKKKILDEATDVF